MDDAAIELVRELYDAVEAGDHDRIRRTLADDLRWRQAGSVVPAAGEDKVGAEALIDEVLGPLEQEWDGFTEEIDELLVAGGRVVATGTYRATYRATGRRLEAELCHLWTVEDGRITAFRQYTDTAAFARAMDPQPG